MSELARVRTSEGYGACDDAMASCPSASTGRLDLVGWPVSMFCCRRRRASSGKYFSFIWLTNYTTESVQGYYALLTYKSETLGTGYPSAQLHSFDLNLMPGQSVSDILLSAFYDLSNAKCIWIAFESKEEQNQFFRVPELDSQYSYYTVNSEQWPRDNFGIK